MNESCALTTIDPASIPNVIFKDQPIFVYIYDVHDGDTVHFLADVNGTIFKLLLRVRGIDTPEIHGAVAEKKAGALAKKRLTELVGAGQRRLTKIIIRDWDKYGGRVLGDIYLDDGRSVAEVMLNEGFARPYSGEKKAPWSATQLAFIESRDASSNLQQSAAN